MMSITVLVNLLNILKTLFPLLVLLTGIAYIFPFKSTVAPTLRWYCLIWECLWKFLFICEKLTTLFLNQLETIYPVVWYFAIERFWEDCCRPTHLDTTMYISTWNKVNICLVLVRHSHASFCSDWSYEFSYKIWSLALPVPGIRGGTWKIWTVPGWGFLFVEYRVKKRRLRVRLYG